MVDETPIATTQEIEATQPILEEQEIRIEVGTGEPTAVDEVNEAHLAEQNMAHMNPAAFN